jgi:DNA polymerase III delta prime subunit
VFDLLLPHRVQDAHYDSRQREAEHAVICLPETQTKILDDVRSWADSTTSPPVCWLSGPAGTGKTTVAHTIAKEYDDRVRLAATFFFWRKTSDRDDINKLVATLAYQIAEKIPSAKESMEKALKLKNDSGIPPPALSTISLEDQLSKLLVFGPVANVNPAGPNLVVIDGLDECASEEGISWLIDWLRKNKPPFRFFLTSRPEPKIKAYFAPGLGHGLSDVQSLSLTESEDDIRKYFVKELEKVWPKQQRVEMGGPSEWPSGSCLDRLVEKSEGLFLYAATAVRYINGRGSPQKRLENVLKLHKGLDSLYVQVIEEAREWDSFDVVMGSLMYIRYPLAINELSTVLAVDNGLDIHFALHGCHSILVIRDNTPITSYHGSLREFLTDQSRSVGLFMTPARYHGRLMLGCLAAITRAFSDGSRAPEYALISWHYHACLFLSAVVPSEGLGELNDEAKKLVKKIDLKWVKSWMIEALYWAGLRYLTGELPPTKVRV